MKHITLYAKLSLLTLSAMLVLSGCSQSLIKDDTRDATEGTSHCSGSEWVDDSSLAVLPIPVVAFFMPHTDLNEIKSDDYLKRCGEGNQLINRDVSIGRAMCFPTALTRIVTLGVWQWCPARVSWEADVQP
ncbi:hypothetical protein [Methylomicrobium lacus]|uniref:hypothetical protein n=1 Tax=Methylomicrobium lacus TaxID=136992 RepID=UPI0035A92849